MKINVNDEDKIVNIIQKEEGRAEARIMVYCDIIGAIKSAEDSLQDENIPKKYWKGCRVFINPGKVPSSYSWPAEGTFITLEKYTSGWFMVTCCRDTVQSCKHGKSQFYKLQLSRLAIENRPTEWEI